MSNLSYDAQINSADLTEFADENEVSEKEAVRQAVFRATRRTTVKGLSASEIHDKLQGKQYPSGIKQIQVNRAVGYWKDCGRLRETGFEDEYGHSRLTGDYFYEESKRTRQRLQDEGCER